jgi:hypothetical protein
MRIDEGLYFVLSPYIAVVLNIVLVSFFGVAGENNLKSLINLPHNIA